MGELERSGSFVTGPRGGITARTGRPLRLCGNLLLGLFLGGRAADLPPMHAAHGILGSPWLLHPEVTCTPLSPPLKLLQLIAKSQLTSLSGVAQKNYFNILDKIVQKGKVMVDILIIKS